MEADGKRLGGRKEEEATKAYIRKLLKAICTDPTLIHTPTPGEEGEGEPNQDAAEGGTDS